MSSPTEPQEGAWQCGDGHMFRYEPPPAWPPWCSKPGCDAGDFRWIIKNEVTSQDWLPEYETIDIDARIPPRYTDMVHRNPDGSDPLVQEPKGKP